MTCGVYIIENVQNGHFYIGSSVNIESRWREHIFYLDKGQHHSSYLQRAWNKYGSGSFVFIALEICDRVKEKLLEREQYYIDILKPAYNVSQTAGSLLGFKHSAETKSKLSEANKGKKHSAETKRKMSEAKRNMSSETKAKISAAGKGHICSAETRAKMSEANKGKPCPTKGIKHSDETRAKMSESHKGHNVSIETRAKIAEAHKGSVVSVETRAKLSEANKGKKHSAETCEKMSVAQKERWQKKKNKELERELERA